MKNIIFTYTKRYHIFELFLNVVREAIGKKSALVIEFFRKGGGGARPIHNFEAHFCALKFMEFFRKI